MAKRSNIYFAIKLVAPRFGVSVKSVVTSTIMEVPGELQSPPRAVKRAKVPKQIEIGKGEAHIIPGIADHFVAAVLDFTEKENAQCKSLLEAEQLVKTKKKYWLSDAYDWFVMPGFVNEAITVGTAKVKPTRKPSALKSGARKTRAKGK